MLVALTLSEWGTIASMAIGISALALSGVALYRQRARPVLDASVIRDGSTGRFAVAVRNSGTAVARTPWFFVVLDGVGVVDHVSRGFIGAGEGRYALTDVPYGRGGADNRRPGVVGCLDSRGRHRVWSLGGGKPKTATGSANFQDLFRLVHPNVDLPTQQGARVSDKPLSDEG